MWAFWRQIARMLGARGSRTLPRVTIVLRVSSSPPFLRAAGSGVELDVLVQPRASSSRFVGCHDGRLKLQVAKAPVDGEANRAVIGLVAELFGIPRRQVRLLRGEASRRKTLSLDLPLGEAEGRLAGVLP